VERKLLAANVKRDAEVQDVPRGTSRRLVDRSSRRTVAKTNKLRPEPFAQLMSVPEGPANFVGGRRDKPRCVSDEE